MRSYSLFLQQTSAQNINISISVSEDFFLPTFSHESFFSNLMKNYLIQTLSHSLRNAIHGVFMVSSFFTIRDATTTLIGKKAERPQTITGILGSWRPPAVKKPFETPVIALTMSLEVRSFQLFSDHKFRILMKTDVMYAFEIAIWLHIIGSEEWLRRIM